MKQENGKYFLESVSIEELANKFGTPLYVYESNTIRENYQRLYKAFSSRYPKFNVHYAIKSNANPHVINVLKEEGAFCDAASANEICLGAKLGFKEKQILFSGNNLSDEDFEVATGHKVLFNLDDISLFDRLKKYGLPDVVSFRINPGIGKSNVHDSDIMAGPDAKFGVPWEKAKQAYQLVKDAGIKKVGVHMMTGSCVTDPDYFAAITRKLLEVVGPVVQELGLSLDFVDIGGGFGIPYKAGESSLDIDLTAQKVVAVFKELTAKYQLGEPTLMVEPGRYFVGNAGYLIGRVLSIKQSYDKFVGTDVGMYSLVRPVLYNAYHHIYAQVAGKQDRPTEVVNICGQACENADAWAKKRNLPKLDIGDLILVENVGAYGYVMSYPYNGRMRPAEVLVDGNQTKLIRHRETLENWLSTVPELG